MFLQRIWQKFMGNPEGRDTDFLPAILEVTETPPSPVGRAVLYIVLALLIAFLAWSVLGHIDETAVAAGKVIPAGQVKVVQVKDKGIVQKILVKEGDFVTEGDPLIVLDPTRTTADVENLRKRAAYYRLDAARLEAEAEGRPFSPEQEGDLDARDYSMEMTLYHSRRSQYRADIEAAQSAVRQKREAVDAARTNYQKYTELYHIAIDKEQRFAMLLEQDAVSEMQLLEQRAQRIELEKNMQAGQSLLRQAEGELAEAEERGRSIDADYRKGVMTELVEARKQSYALAEELKKADEDARLATITAPCDGQVYNLTIHTIGGIVTDAQPLLMIVPADSEMEFEVWADNKDIGFIKKGQEAEVKVDTFDFQKFGVVRAVVEEIGPDAATDEKDLETYRKYRVLLRPRESSVSWCSDDGKFLLPGMHVQAEVKIKEKRIVDFFLDPFRKYLDESLRER